jgi:hypothetical protein
MVEVKAMYNNETKKVFISFCVIRLEDLKNNMECKTIECFADTNFNYYILQLKRKNQKLVDSMNDILYNTPDDKIMELYNSRSAEDIYKLFSKVTAKLHK